MALPFALPLTPYPFGVRVILPSYSEGVLLSPLVMAKGMHGHKNDLTFGFWFKVKSPFLLLLVIKTKPLLSRTSLNSTLYLG